MKPVATSVLPRVAILVLALLVVAQGVIVVTLWQRLGIAQAEHASLEQARLDAARRAEAERATLLARLRTAESRLAELTPPAKPADAPPTGSILLERNLQSQVAFTYGTPQEAGRYVGQTLQRLFAARQLQTPEEVEQSLRENELNILSMGPFIKDAEQLESDPAVFSEFQAEVLGEVFALDPARRVQARELIRGLKAGTATEPAGSVVWNAANEQATRLLVSLLTPEEQIARRTEIDFISSYGVLVVPTYSILTK
jgi:hypothetical protein